MWQNIEAAPADSILGLTEAFRNDPNPAKVNLGVGIYKDEQGKTPILQCVKKAEARLIETEESKVYLPISGAPAYTENVQKLLFGAESEVISSKRAITAHAPGGTGALRMGAGLLKTFFPEAKVWVSTPTWANHTGIFVSTGFEIVQYPYYDATNRSVDFEALLTSLRSVPEGDIVLLHACCHNPTGVDLTLDQWRQVVAIAQERNWIPFLDFAYQGFGVGTSEDRCAVELCAEAGIDFFVASSFSKNFGMYNERTGAITVVATNQESAAVALSHLKKTIRVVYSNPPAHGGLVAATVLGDPELYDLWQQELQEMRERIIAMRVALVEGLSSRGVDQDFSFITQQSGMFSFSGLSDEVVAWLRREKSIYVVGGGRINLAGLTASNIDYVCDAIAEALRS